MPWPENTMDVFKLLNKSNCRQCGAPTCLAFAAAVFKGEKAIGACPYLDRKKHQFDTPNAFSEGLEAGMEANIAQLKQQIRAIDLADAAQRTDGVFSNGKLTVKIMGKDFSVDTEGNLSSDIHIHGWIAIPFFHYILKCHRAPLSGRWLPVRELEGGRDWAHFFSHRCDKPLKKIADTYTDLFEDMVHLFNGKQVDNHYQSDISVVLRPLPKLPMLICYWKPEDGMPSDINLFFDANAEKSLPIESIYSLTAGLFTMFEKIALRHGA